MEAKKSNKMNLEKSRFLFLQCGIAIALATTLVALEWRTSTNFMPYAEGIEIDDFSGEEIIIPLTRTPPKKKPPVLPQVQPKIIISDNFADLIEDEWNFTNEIDPKDMLANYAYFPVEDEIPDETPFIVVHNMPKFMGGDLGAFRNFIQKKVSYPQQAQDMHIEGTVYIYFVVNSKGKLTDVKVARGVDPLLDNEVLSALKNTPEWEPGKQHGNPVSVMFTMPVSFKLN